MNFREREVKLAYLREAILCIITGTLAGLFTYGFFLFFHIDIFGWNLGLIFAPVVAGFVETQLANKIIGESIGAISAFILFLYTVFYSFILKNPTLGFNLITLGSIAVILQAAFPTVMNCIIVVGGLSIVSYFSGVCKRITSGLNNKSQYIYYKYIAKKPQEVEIETVSVFNEHESNFNINDLGFFFITSTDVTDRKMKIVGLQHATVIIEKDKRLINTGQEQVEQEIVNKFKKGKDECLTKLVKNVKNDGGNGIVDLEIQYSLIGLGGDSYQVTCMGMGVYIE